MEPVDDSALLRAYCDSQSDDAFAELVARHINLVYSVALRQTDNTSHAEEITQAVFIILAKKAHGLRHDKALSSWLFQATRLTANNFIRSERRRQIREQEAHMQSLLNEPDDGFWQQIAPLLDAAVGNLNEQDRHAIVLRFYEGKNLRDVGVALALNEEAAKKKVSRALDKLQKHFSKHGIHSSADMIAETISVNSIQTAPALLVKVVTAAAIAKGATASASILTLTKGVLKLMAWTKMKTTVVVSACVLLTAGTATEIIHYAKTRPVIGIPSDWSVLAGNANQWDWSNGRINAHSITGESILASNKKYGDFTLSAVLGSTNRDAEFTFRTQDADNGYFLLLVPDGTPWSAENGSIIKLVKKVAGNEMDLASFKRRGLPQAAKITLVVNGAQFEVRMNDVTILKARDTKFPSGYIGLRVYGDSTKPSDITVSNLVFY